MVYVMVTLTFDMLGTKYDAISLIFQYTIYLQMETYHKATLT